MKNGLNNFRHISKYFKTSIFFFVYSIKCKINTCNGKCILTVTYDYSFT